jgi:hypothetical protein
MSTTNRLTRKQKRSKQKRKEARMHARNCTKKKAAVLVEQEAPKNRKEKRSVMSKIYAKLRGK